jgi:mannose-1-phosphate guanylyltransferase
MFASGQYSWNSGMFIWKVSTILEEFRAQMPELYQQINTISQTIGTSAYDETIKRIWPKIKKQTIDYGIMEKSKRVAVMPVDFQWADVGNWTSLKHLLPQDERGNAQRGEVLLLDCKDNLIIADKRLIATIGLENLIIVDTPDALLICPQDRVQEVREVVERLKAAGRQDLI